MKNSKSTKLYLSLFRLIATFSQIVSGISWAGYEAGSLAVKGFASWRKPSTFVGGVRLVLGSDKLRSSMITGGEYNRRCLFEGGDHQFFRVQELGEGTGPQIPYHHKFLKLG